MELRRELLTRTAEDYASARKRIKSQIVDQLVAATGYGRKYAITLLRQPWSLLRRSWPRRLPGVLVSVSTGRLASRNARSRLDRFVTPHDLLEQLIGKHAYDSHQTLNARIPT